jgi:hypothetical protein
MKSAPDSPYLTPKMTPDFPGSKCPSSVPVLIFWEKASESAKFWKARLRLRQELFEIRVPVLHTYPNKFSPAASMNLPAAFRFHADVVVVGKLVIG